MLCRISHHCNTGGGDSENATELWNGGSAMAQVAFRGWSSAALEFYEGLEADNSKQYWHSHKDVYDHVVRAPMDQLLGELESEFGEIHLFRPYRDTRFSADKPPYKTSIAATVGAGYVEFSASGLRVGAGYYQMSSPQLDRYRAAVDRQDSGSELEAVVAAIRSQGSEIRSFDELKTAPRGFPRDHPRIDLLRFKGIITLTAWPPGAWLATKAAKGRVEMFFRNSAPLIEWLVQHVGPDLSS